jgi:hypothetical protein
MNFSSSVVNILQLYFRELYTGPSVEVPDFTDISISWSQLDSFGVLFISHLWLSRLLEQFLDRSAIFWVGALVDGRVVVPWLCARERILVKNFSGKILLKSGFKGGMQAHMIPVLSSPTDQLRADMDFIVISTLSRSLKDTVRMIDAAAANRPSPKSVDTINLSLFGSLSFQKSGSGRMQRITSVKAEKEVEK